MRLFRSKNNDNIFNALKKTRHSILSDIPSLFRSSNLKNYDWNELEDILISADLGTSTTKQIITQLKTKISENTLTDSEQIVPLIKTIFSDILNINSPNWAMDFQHTPKVILMVGINGVGKTTAIGKIASLYTDIGKTVIAGAGDTYRAAAIEQLQSWGQTSGFQVISHNQGSDSSAVAFDTISTAQSKNTDVVLIDTAGRLHDNSNLMQELQKIHRVSQKAIGKNNIHVLLTLDATTGQNGLLQAESFNKIVPCDGIFLSKLDGSSKGGIVLPIYSDLNIPICFVGTGEQKDDISLFDSPSFIQGLIA